MDETEKRQFEADLAKRGLELGEHVRLARTIQAPAADVWKVISKPGELNKYHPYCRENTPVYKWPGMGSRDGITYYSGLYFERDFIYWREGAGYDLQISPSQKDGVDLLEFATARGNPKRAVADGHSYLRVPSARNDQEELCAKRISARASRSLSTAFCGEWSNL